VHQVISSRQRKAAFRPLSAVSVVRFDLTPGRVPRPYEIKVNGVDRTGDVDGARVRIFMSFRTFPPAFSCIFPRPILGGLHHIMSV
jgi:hypothetical protein